MDYEFKTDYIGQPIAKFSMGHEAFGRWFTEELGSDQGLMVKIIEVVNLLELGEIRSKSYPGKEFVISLDSNEVRVSSYSLEIDIDEELPENTNPFDDELMADCGLQDFKRALLSWQEFLQG